MAFCMFGIQYNGILHVWACINELVIGSLQFYITFKYNICSIQCIKRSLIFTVAVCGTIYMNTEYIKVCFVCFQYTSICIKEIYSRQNGIHIYDILCATEYSHPTTGASRLSRVTSCEC